LIPTSTGTSTDTPTPIASATQSPTVAISLTPTQAATLTPTQIPDTVKPQVNWAQPGADASFVGINTSSVLLVTDASDNVSIARVHFYRWDPVRLVFVDVGTVITPPYQWDLDMNPLVFGWNEIDVESFDLAGNRSNRQPIFLQKKIQMLFLPVLKK
jgi:hypothetical protein